MVDLDAGAREQVARQWVERARVARLATVRPDGSPHVVPITYAVAGDTIVTAIDHKPKGTTTLQRLRNIEACPAVSVLVDHYDDDWSALWWVRADGTARVVHHGDAGFDEATAQLVAKYAAYRSRPPGGPVIVVTVARWVSWSGGAGTDLDVNPGGT